MGSSLAHAELVLSAAWATQLPILHVGSPCLPGVTESPPFLCLVTPILLQWGIVMEQSGAGSSGRESVSSDLRYLRHGNKQTLALSEL